MNAPAPVLVRVCRRFDAAAERVFDAWLSPEMIGAWMFGSNVRDEEVVRIAIDARVGGEFSFLVRRQGQEIDHVGRYLEIVRPTRLVFSWGIAGSDSSQVNVDITPRMPGSELVLTHQLHPAWASYAARNEQAWNTILASFNHGLSATTPGGAGINDTYGILSDPCTLTLERLLPGPIERVWQYLVDGEKRRQWFASGSMEPRVGGIADLRFKHSELSAHVELVPQRYLSMESGLTMRGHVTQFDPPRTLAFTFGEDGNPSHVTFDLAPIGDQVRMVITHQRLGNRDAVLSVASGWHTHVAILIDRLNVIEPRAFWATHERLDAQYREHLHLQPRESSQG